jgi:methionyl-tRNA formyltransferase
MNMTNFVFFGSSHFSVFLLDSLKEKGWIPSLIVSTPDKPQGRKLVLTPTPVSVWAKENNIPLITPASLKVEIPELHGFNLFVVASYGKIIPQSILDIPTSGSLNIHPSLLPKFRGASPLQTTILEDEQNTGVVIIKMDKEMDHGPIVARSEVRITPWPLSMSELEEKLAVIGADILKEALPSYLDGSLTLEEQDHSKATFTKKIEKEDGEIFLTDLDRKAYLKYKAFDVWPGVFFFTERKGIRMRVKVKAAAWNETACTMDILRVLPEGKNEMTWKEFQNYLLS